MKTKSNASLSSFYLALIAIIILLMLPGLSLLAQESGETNSGSGPSFGDIFNFIVVFGYIGGVLVLLPWVIYTNLKENLATMKEGSVVSPDLGLTEAERNERSEKILLEIDSKLTRFDQEDETYVTITKGSQARFARKGLSYISKILVPSKPEIIARTNELIVVYQDRSKRVFTGSKWIIGFAVALLAIFIYQTGFSGFVVLHSLGIVFYVLSSRTPIYLLEKRIERFGNIGFGMIGSVFSGLFIGSGDKYYKVYSDGRKERDHESELTHGVIYFIIIAILGLFLAFLTAFLGVVNFVINYMNNALIPVKPESWYQKNFALT